MSGTHRPGAAEDGCIPGRGHAPQLFASAITMPNLTIQVRDDAWTKNPEDGPRLLRQTYEVSN